MIASIWKPAKDIKVHQRYFYLLVDEDYFMDSAKTNLCINVLFYSFEKFSYQH